MIAAKESYITLSETIWSDLVKYTSSKPSLSDW